MKMIIKGWKFDDKGMELFNKTYDTLLEKMHTQETVKFKLGDLEGKGVITHIEWKNKKEIETLEVIFF